MNVNEYRFEWADNVSALSDFKCGIEEMDKFIKDPIKGLSSFIKLGLAKLWIVYENDKVVAFFALSKGSVVINNMDKENLEMDKKNEQFLPDESYSEKFWDRDSFPSVEIEYLAVCEEKRNTPGVHLGTFIIDSIIERELQDDFTASMFLSVDAFESKKYSAVGFYNKCGFYTNEYAMNLSRYKRQFNNETTNVVRMHKPIRTQK